MKTLLFILSIFVSFGALGQHGNFTDIRLINGDSVLAGTNNGTVYYDRTLNKFRFRQASSWINFSTGIPGGSTTQFQFNNAGVFGGTSAVTYNNGTGLTTFTVIPVVGTGSPLTGGTGASSMKYADDAVTAASLPLPATDGDVVISTGTSITSYGLHVDPSFPTSGRIVGGIWNANGITAPYGGTGQTVYTVAATPYASTTSALSQLAAGANGQVMNLVGGVPTWSDLVLGPFSTTLNGYVLASGGAGRIPQGDNTWIAPGSAGKIFYSNGTNFVNSVPTFPASASATTRKIIVSDGTNWLASTETYAVPGTSGNVMTSNGTNW